MTCNILWHHTHAVTVSLYVNYKWVNFLI